MASWFDLKGTFQTIYKIGKNKTSIDANAPTASRNFYMPDSEVDLRNGTAGQIISQTGANTIGWLDNYSEALVTGAFNDTGSIINKGQVVYFNTRQGDRPKAYLAQANALSTSERTVGLAYETVGDGLDIRVVENGVLKGLDTDIVGWVEGDILWLDAAVAGGITNVRPTGSNYAVEIGILVRKHQNEGVILVRVDFDPKLNQLQDVSIPTTPTNGQVLTYNSSTGVWYAATSGGGGGGGYTEISDGGNLTGTYDGEVYCMGDVSLTGNVTVKGNLYAVGNMTNPSGYNLIVNGDLIVEGSLDFTRSTIAQSGELNVSGDCHVGYEIVSTLSENITGYTNSQSMLMSSKIGVTYQTFLTIIAPNFTFEYDFKVGSRIVLNSINYDLVSIAIAAPSTEYVVSVIDAENFSLLNTTPASFQARGLKVGDTISFTSGPLAFQSGAIQAISGDALTFALGTFSSPPSLYDTLTIIPSSGQFVDLTLKGTQALTMNDPSLVGINGTIDYDTFKSILFREKLNTTNNIFIGGDLNCYRFDVSADQSLPSVKGKEVTIEGNLTLKSFKTDVSNIDYYDYILLQGSDGNDANTLTVRGSVYNGSIFGKPSPTNSTLRPPSKSSNVKIYGDCILSSINAYQIFSGYVDLSSRNGFMSEIGGGKSGGDFFVGGKFVGGGINLSGASALSMVNAYNYSSGNLTVEGDIFISFGESGTPYSDSGSNVNSSSAPGFFDTGKIAINGGNNISNKGGGGAGILYCGGNVYGTNFAVGEGTSIELECVAGNEGDLGRITIANDCYVRISFRAGDSALSYAKMSIPNASYSSVYIGGNAFGNITIRSGDSRVSSLDGGKVESSALYLKGDSYGAIQITAGNGSGSNGGLVNQNPVNFNGNYIDSLSITSGNGVKGGDIWGTFALYNQTPTIRNITLLTGNGITGPAGSYTSSTVNTFNCVGSISISLGTTQNSTLPLDFTDRTVTISGSMNVSSITLQNMTSTSLGGNASAGINLIINGNVNLINGGSIALRGGSATSGRSCKPPSLRINGNLFGSLEDTAGTGVIISGGNVSTGDASFGFVAGQTLYVVGDVNIGRITVNGGNQTSAIPIVVGGSAGDILANAIQVNGKLKSARITMTGGNLTSSGAQTGTRGGNAGTVWAGSLNVRILTCNGGTVNTGTSTKGSAGGFVISNALVTDNSYIGTFTANDSTGGIATSNSVQNILLGHVIIDSWTLPTRTTYTIRCSAVPASIIVRSFTGKQKLANSSNVETAANLAADSMYFSTGATWRSVTNAAFV